MIAALSALEAKIKHVIATLDTDARAEYERLLAEAKTEAAEDLARIRTLAGDLETELARALEAAAPTVEAAAKAALQQFVAGLAPVLAEAAHGM